MTRGELIYAIASKLKTQLNQHKDTMAIAKSTWKFLSGLKMFGVECKKGDVDSVESDVVDDLARAMARFTEGASQ